MNQTELEHAIDNAKHKIFCALRDIEDRTGLEVSDVGVQTLFIGCGYRKHRVSGVGIHFFDGWDKNKRY